MENFESSLNKKSEFRSIFLIFIKMYCHEKKRLIVRVERTKIILVVELFNKKIGTKMDC